jgi:hypothetical protein
MTTICVTKPEELKTVDPSNGRVALRMFFTAGLMVNAVSQPNFSDSVVSGVPEAFCPLPEATTGTSAMRPQDEVITRDIAAEELTAWARTMIGGDTSHMLDI